MGGGQHGPGGGYMQQHPAPLQQQYASNGYHHSSNQNFNNGGGPGGGFLNSAGFSQPPQQIFPGDNFMPPSIDAFSTPLNAGGQGGGFGGGPGVPQQNFGSPNMVSDGFMRNSNSNFGVQNQREGMIINNSRTQDNYYQN